MKRIVGIVISLVLISLSFTACNNEKEAGLGNKEYDADGISDNVIDANSGFAFDIFKKLNREDSDTSIFISPLSISTALTMTYNGAESTTEDAMGKTLGFKNIKRDMINQSYMNLLNYLEKVDKKIELNIANSIWIRNGETIKEDFLSNNKSNFNAEIDTLDFSKNSSVDIINKWISDATNGEIDKMLEPPIDSDVIMYLINAIYFKGEWGEQFDFRNTFDHAFKTSDGSEQTVRMMTRRGKVEYTKGDGYKAVRLPYGNGSTSMYLILPDDGIDINKFIEGMDIRKWDTIHKNMAEMDGVVLQIPKFRLEYGIKDLKDSLESLGMGEAFSDQADFSGIGEDIFISRVLHKAVIEVSEEGSRVAAATVVETNKAAALAPITFIADRPFMFIIADDTTGTILFIGKLLNID